MAKTIPTEQIISLYNKLAALSPKDSDRQRFIAHFANSFGVSHSTVRRQLRQHVPFGKTVRADKNKPRHLSQEEMLLYCRLIAALKMRTSNKKKSHLSTQSCIRLLEEHGVETPQGFVKVPPGLLKKQTVNRYLKNWGYDTHSMRIEPAVVRFEAAHSNDCWQFDFTPSDLKKLSPDRPSLFIASVVDDKSGVLYSQYLEAKGEDALTALKFLFNAMSAKQKPGFLFQGIPDMIYTDNGSFAKSALFKRALAALGIELRTHLPREKDGRRTTARSKGKVERSHRTLKNDFEPLFHLHCPKNLEEADEWAQHYLSQYNGKAHRSENCTRQEAWQRFLPEAGYREMCSWEKFSQLVRSPETRKVGSDGCVSIESVAYQLSTDMAGLEVTLLHGVFDQEIHVQFQDEVQGPFYPFKGPIPLHTFKRPQKSSREKRADDIGDLAKSLVVPPSVMTGNPCDKMIHRLEKAHIIQPTLASIPFEEKTPSHFRNRLEAKQAIAHHLNRPLAELSDAQRAFIDEIVDGSLEKETVLSKVRDYFTLSLCLSVKQEGA